MNDNPHIGSSFDDFLEEEGLLAAVQATAIKRFLAWQVEKAMEERNMSKAAMAREMKTSRSSLDRLLDPGNGSVTINTLDRAARAVGKRVVITLADVGSSMQSGRVEVVQPLRSGRSSVSPGRVKTRKVQSA